MAFVGSIPRPIFPQSHPSITKQKKNLRGKMNLKNHLKRTKNKIIKNKKNSLENIFILHQIKSLIVFGL